MLIRQLLLGNEAEREVLQNELVAYSKRTHSVLPFSLTPVGLSVFWNTDNSSQRSLIFQLLSIYDTSAEGVLKDEPSDHIDLENVYSS